MLTSVPQSTPVKARTSLPSISLSTVTCSASRSNLRGSAAVLPRVMVRPRGKCQLCIGCKQFPSLEDLVPLSPGRGSMETLACPPTPSPTTLASRARPALGHRGQDEVEEMEEVEDKEGRSRWRRRRRSRWRR